MDVWLSRFLISATDGFLMLDENLRVLNANESWLQQAGLKYGEIIGRHIEDIFPDMGKEKLELYRKVMVTCDPVEFRHEDSTRLNGRVFDVKVFKIEEGIGVITREITEQAKYERGLEALHIHTSKIAEAKTLEEVCRLTYTLLQDALGFPVIDLIKIEDGYLIDVFSYGSEILQIPINGPGITARAARTGKTQFINDTREDSDYIKGPREWIALSELTVPVKIDGEPRLLINVESPEVNAFTENDRKLIEILTRHLSSDIKRINYENTLEALEKYSKLLHKASTLDEVVRTTLGFITDAMGYSRQVSELLKEKR
ncbi:GAF domain-containing protein [Candidatus Bathyarchaeota archaeon]|nr:GAF domain-containing protein [Candidatus Bathyarchaeota archaeon]